MSPFPKLSEDPGYAAADAKLTELKSALAIAEREREGRSQSPPVISDSERRQRALLGEASTPTPTVDELTQRISDLHGAIEIQRRILIEAECNAGRRIAEQIKPQYAAILKRGAKAVKALAEFLAEETAFGDALHVNGIRPCGALPRHTLPAGIDADYCNAWLANVAADYSV